MRYSLLLHYPEPAEGELDEEVMASALAAFGRYAEDLASAGVMISGDVLQPSTASTTVSMAGGELRVQDGPFAATKEQLAGSFILDVPDLDAALAWAERCPAVQWGTVEVRPSAVYVHDGKWLPSQ